MSITRCGTKFEHEYFMSLAELKRLIKKHSYGLPSEKKDIEDLLHDWNFHGVASLVAKCDYFGAVKLFKGESKC